MPAKIQSMNLLYLKRARTIAACISMMSLLVHAEECRLIDLTGKVEARTDHLVLIVNKDTVSEKDIRVPIKVQSSFAPYINRHITTTLVVNKDLVMDGDLIQDVRYIDLALWDPLYQGGANAITPGEETPCPEKAYFTSELKIDGDQVVLYLLEDRNILVSHNCLESGCLALEAPVIKGTLRNKKQGVWEGNPAATFCGQNGGDYIVGTYPDGNQDGICQFKDGSMIMGWDYYMLFGKSK